MDTHADIDPEACRALAVGFASPSAAREAARDSLGMAPGRYRRGGEGLELGWIVADTALGPMVAAATGEGLCLVEFLDGEPLDTQANADLRVEAESRVRDRFPRARLHPAEGDTRALLQAVLGRIELPEAGETLPLDIIGTAFQRRVWMLLRELGWGERVSYSELARRLGRPGASRAVARACGENPLAVLVPCHRVVGADGALRGYRWGLARKQRLLEREARADEEEETGG